MLIRSARGLRIGGLLVGSAAGIPVVISYWRASTSDVGESFLASPLATLGTFLFLAMPLSFAYAILRHRLFDIRVLIRQGLRYALARRALVEPSDFTPHASPAIVELLAAAGAPG